MDLEVNVISLKLLCRVLSCCCASSKWQLLCLYMNSRSSIEHHHMKISTKLLILLYVARLSQPAILSDITDDPYDTICTAMLNLQDSQPPLLLSCTHLMHLSIHLRLCLFIPSFMHLLIDGLTDQLIDSLCNQSILWWWQGTEGLGQQPLLKP